MKKDLQLWRKVAGQLEKGEAATLLVVAESSGSSPGRQGFKMAIAGDELHGSIGGGVMEVALAEMAKGKRKNETGKSGPDIGDPRSEIIRQVHRKNDPNTSGMICSGEQTVIVFELDDLHLEAVLDVISALEDRSPASLRITSREIGTARTDESNTLFHFKSSDDGEFLYEETLGHKNKLVIIGGGHCALALSELISKMDFHISLFDDRPELNTLDKNEFVHQKTIVDSYEDIAQFIDSGRDTYVVVMTLGYKFDGIVIRKLIDKEFKYFGVLGSKAKMGVLLRELENEGIDSAKLEKIHTPIGLEINSQTPEEIAVSIAAEIIAVKNAKG